jgi:hypothetical protein
VGWGMGAGGGVGDESKCGDLQTGDGQLCNPSPGGRLLSTTLPRPLQPPLVQPLKPCTTTAGTPATQALLLLPCIVGSPRAPA